MFWLLAILLALLASAFVLLPLLFRRAVSESGDRSEINLALYRERVAEVAQNSDDPEQLQLEAQKELLSDVNDVIDGPSSAGNHRIALAAALFVPVMAFFIYSDIGLGRGAMADVWLAEALHEADPEDEAGYRYFVQRVEERVNQRPNHTDTLFLLARAYANLGEYEKAIERYEALLETFPRDPGLLAQYAEMLFVADGKTLTTRAGEAVARALQANPHNLTMLEIKAIAAMRAGDTAGALESFNRALQTGVTGERAELIRRAIISVHEQAGLASVPAPAAASSSSQTSATGEPATPAPQPDVAGGRVIRVFVEASDAVNLPGESAVFVYARALEGPPMPLAVQRMRLADLPATVVLNESMAMMAGMSLANFDKVVVIARVSRTGVVAPSAGDFEARTGSIDLTSPVPLLKLSVSERLAGPD